MNNLFVIDGQSGAAKTPLVAEIVRILNEEESIYTISRAPFTYANKYVVDNDLVKDYPLGIYSCWGNSVDSSIFAETLLENHINEGILEAEEKNGIIIFDRCWLTICMGILESAHRESEKHRRIQHWINQNMPTFFLDTIPEITQSRQSWNPILPWTNENIHTDFNNRREYISKYNNLLDRHQTLQAKIDLDSLAQNWVKKILKYRKNSQ